MCQPFKIFLKLLMRLKIMHLIMCIPFFLSLDFLIITFWEVHLFSCLLMQLYNQSHGSNLHLDLVKATCWNSNKKKNQIGEEMWFKWHWSLCRSWCQTGWSEFFRNCWSTGIFPQSFKCLHRHVQKRETLPWAEVLCVKMHCWCQRSKDTGQTASTW